MLSVEPDLHCTARDRAASKVVNKFAYERKIYTLEKSRVSGQSEQIETEATAQREDKLKKEKEQMRKLLLLLDFTSLVTCRKWKVLLGFPLLGSPVITLSMFLFLFSFRKFSIFIMFNFTFLEAKNIIIQQHTLHSLLQMVVKHI